MNVRMGEDGGNFWNALAAAAGNPFWKPMPEGTATEIVSGTDDKSCFRYHDNLQEPSHSPVWVSHDDIS